MAAVDGNDVTCRQTLDHAVIAGERAGVAVLGCEIPDGGWSTQSDFDVSGRVVTVTDTSFELETCAGDACVDSSVRISVQAPDLDLRLSLPVGATVRAHGSTHFFYTCTTELAVESLPSWQGADNPAPAASGLYLASAEGGLAAGDAFHIDPIRLDCASSYTGQSCGGEAPGLYALGLTLAGSSTNPIVLPMGQTVSVRVPNTSEQWSARNLRSYQTDYCDDYWNWAFWVALKL